MRGIGIFFVGLQLLGCSLSGVWCAPAAVVMETGCLGCALTSGGHSSTLETNGLRDAILARELDDSRSNSELTSSNTIPPHHDYRRAVQTSSSPPTPLPKTPWTHKVLGYYALSQSATMPPSAVPWSLLTHILLAFGTLTSSFSVTIPAQSVSLAQEVFSTALANDVKPVLSIGGYGAGSQFFSAMVKTKTSRAVFLQSLLNLVQEYALTGVDLDWEYPGRESSAGVPFDEIEDVPNLLLLLQEMRATLPETVTISAALSSMYPWTANTTTNTTDLSPFAELLDWGALMDYNFLGVNSSITGSASPLTAGVGGKNIQMGAGNWTRAGMPWEKLVLGIPGYGRAWIMDDVCVPLSLVPCPYRDLPTSWTIVPFSGSYTPSAHVSYPLILFPNPSFLPGPFDLSHGFV